MNDQTTALTARLGIRHPILLAPMNGCAGARLAVAVSQAGGLGLIGGGVADPVWLEAEYDKVGDAQVGVGFITWYLAERPQTLDIALDRKPVAVMLTAGDHTPFADAIKTAGAALICQVQTLEQAVNAARTGADIIVAQGQESGGHGMSARSTMALAPAILDAVGRDIPVVAAGGIADGRGLAAVLALGCDGVLLGTAFAAATESDWPEDKKAALVAASGYDTVRTTVFDILRRGAPWPEPYNARGLRNRFTDRWHGDEAGLLRALKQQRADYAAAEAQGELGGAAVWAGEGVDMVRCIEPASEIMARILREAAETRQT